MNDPLITIERFRDLPLALLAKGKLESAGIQCWLADENMVADGLAMVQPHWRDAAAGKCRR